MVNDTELRIAETVLEQRTSGEYGRKGANLRKLAMIDEVCGTTSSKGEDL